MPRARRDGDEVEGLDREHTVADERGALAAQDHHRVYVLVPLERRIARRRDLEVTELAAEIGAAKQRLARHVAKRRAALFLVARELDAIPAITAVARRERTNRIVVHGRPPQALTASTNSRQRAKS